MGFNSTLVVCNDALNGIENDPEFGKNVAQAIREFGQEREIISQSLCHGAQVVACHHADDHHLILVGGNTAENVGYCGGRGTTVFEALKYRADCLGYKLVRKPVHKKFKKLLKKVAKARKKISDEIGL